MGLCESKLDSMMKKIEKEFWVEAELLNEIAKDMELKMIDGLKDEDSSPIKMLLSYVDSLPTGNEKGRFYAVDLGGTNLRVMHVKLEGNGKPKIESKLVVVPHRKKIGKAHELFDYIAKNVHDVVQTEEACEFGPLPDQKRELGFTFSFPVSQTRIDSGKLLNWSKDFDIKDAIGEDVVELLGEALRKQGLDVRVTALLNDTVGNLAGSRFCEQKVVAAVILGTGMNAAYVEQTDNILKPYGTPPESRQMVINTELGNYGDKKLLPLTDYDRAIDADSPNKGKQALEKMLSGRYLGEIVRRILLHLAEDAALFGKPDPPKLLERNIVRTENVSKMHNDKSPDLSYVGAFLQDVLEIPNVSLETKQRVVKICEIVGTRGARLSAAAILSILKKLGKDKMQGEEEIVVAVDGALFGKYEQFKLCLQKTLTEELLMKVELTQYTDASGIGAALVAASHTFYH